MKKRLSWLAISALLAVSAAACNDTVSTGAAGGETPGPSGTATPAATATGAATPGEPGGITPPESLGGWFSIGNIHSVSNDPPTGLGGSGFFSVQPLPLGWADPWVALMNEYPDMALDTCGWGYGASIAFGGSGQVTLPAGDVKLSSTSGSGDFLFLPLGGLDLYIAQAMAGVYEPAGGQYVLTGSGDQVGAFTTPFFGPADIHVTTPADLTTVSPRVIDRTQDFPLQWESEHDNLPVFAFLLQAEDENSAPQVVVCKFADDGEATIPSSAFQLLPVSGFNTIASMQVMKYRIHLFEAPGATAPVMVNFSSGYDVKVSYSN